MVHNFMGNSNLNLNLLKQT